MNKPFNIALQSIKKDAFLSISIFVSMTMTFLVLGTFITTFVFTQTAIKSLEKEVLVSIYFKDDFPADSILKTKEKLQKDVRVSEVKYISKEDAFKIFTELNKGDELLLESVTSSILPASLELRTVKIGDIEKMAGELTKYEGVEDVKFFKDAVNRFKFWSSVINTAGLVLVSVFLFISFSIIVIALRLTISAKGTEISILRLVGASEAYVKKPLITQAIIYSLGSAIIAGVVLFAILNMFVFQNLFVQDELTLLSNIPTLKLGSFLYTILLSLFLVASALILGFIGSTAAIKKYLNL